MVPHPEPSSREMHANHYDILIVGAGVAGSALAHALSTTTARLRGSPVRVALLERSLSEPDRVVGELMLPAGVDALRTLGMEDALEGIDAMPADGCCVIRSGRLVRIPYVDGRQGRHFHHGRFVMRLREYAKRASGVDVIEATVYELIECEHTTRVLGVRATRSSPVGVSTSAEREREPFFADLVVIADGCFSKFRNTVMGKSARRLLVRGYSVSAILKNVELPMPRHASLTFLETPGAPVAGFCQLSEHDTRMVVGIHSLLSNLKALVLTNVVLQLPASLHAAVLVALDRDRLRCMPNTFLPPVEQGGEYTKEGILLLGDSWNTRPSITGSGMTVALIDVILLANMLGKVGDYDHWDQISEMLARWHWARKSSTSMINITSAIVHELFMADDECMVVFRDAFLEYIQRGDEYVRIPATLLAGFSPSPVQFLCFVCNVMFSAIWMTFTCTDSKSEDESIPVVPGIWEYPFLLIKSVRVLWTGINMFFPIIWSEIRWW